MKHIIGITLVDPTDKQYSTVRTYRGMEYEDGEITHEEGETAHDVAWKLLMDAAYIQHSMALKRAGVNIREVNEKFKEKWDSRNIEDDRYVATRKSQGHDLADALGTITDTRPLQQVSKEELEDYASLPWKDNQFPLSTKYYDSKRQRIMILALRARINANKGEPVTVRCGEVKYTVSVEGDFLRRTPVK